MLAVKISIITVTLVFVFFSFTRLTHEIIISLLTNPLYLHSMFLIFWLYCIASLTKRSNNTVRGSYIPVALLSFFSIFPILMVPIESDIITIIVSLFFILINITIATTYFRGQTFVISYDIMKNPKLIPFISFMIIKIVVLALMVNYMSFFKDFFEPITINTYGLLNELLFVNLILLGLFLLFFRMLSNEKVIRLIEKSGLFNFKNFVGGMLFFISIVITIHVSVYLINLATDYQLITVFREFSLTEIMGEYLSQIFGVALLEELFYRFIVIIYLHQLFTSRTKLNRKTITAYTLIISQVLFSVIHLLPVLLLHGMPDLFILLFQLLQYIIVGFYLFYAFYKTNNLWMAIFLHALINTNITLYYIDRTFLIDYSTLVILFSSLILLPFYHSKTKETV